MAPPASRIKRAFFVIYVVLVHAVLIGLLFERFVLPKLVPTGALHAEAVRDPVPDPQTSPAALPTELPYRPVEPSSTPSPFATTAQTPGIIIPVAGVLPQQLTDTFSDARAEGRVHEAIDIPAPAGTRVLAAADGRVVKFHDSVAGGITIYQLSEDGRYFFYYAHLQRRADGLREGDTVARGKEIGYVGNTGNAGAGNYHLHFSITTAPDPKRFWEGVAINPYPVLKGTAPLQ